LSKPEAIGLLTPLCDLGKKKVPDGGEFLHFIVTVASTEDNKKKQFGT
jgi:hypothetical protein